MAEEKRQGLQRKIEQAVAAATVGGKVDLEKLQSTNPPIASVLREFMESKTGRDDPFPIVKDLVRSLESRDPATRLGKALATLEKAMKAKS